MDASLSLKLKVNTQTLPHSLQVTDLNGQRLPDITLITEPVSLTLSGNHAKMLQFFVFQAPLTPLVLGYPWLHQHNPVLDWKEERVLGWGEGCHMSCLRAATLSMNTLNNTQPHEPPDLSAVLGVS